MTRTHDVLMGLDRAPVITAEKVAFRNPRDGDYHSLKECDIAK